MFCNGGGREGHNAVEEAWHVQERVSRKELPHRDRGILFSRRKLDERLLER